VTARIDALSDSRLSKTMTHQSPHPQRAACSSRRVGSFTETLALWRDALHVNGGNKQGTSNCGTQPPTTIATDPRIHARSGQPLAVTLNGTVRDLTYKQEAGGSSPSPPIPQPLQIGHFDALLARASLVFAERETVKFAALSREGQAG
jgi:hypothetical protein